MNDDKLDKSTLRKSLKLAASEILELGGIRAFRNGDWLLNLIPRSFKNYSERATPEYLRAKYPGLSREQIAQKLIGIAATNAALVGGVAGAAVSVDELFTVGEGGIGLPANVALAFVVVAWETCFTTKLQLELVFRLSALYDVALDLDDPEDILTILSFAFGGGIAELAGKEGMKVGGNLAERAVRKFIKKEVLESLKRIAKKLGYKLLQRGVIKAIVPGVSILIGAGWNMKTTKAVGKIAIKHFTQIQINKTATATRQSAEKAQTDSKDE